MGNKARLMVLGGLALACMATARGQPAAMPPGNQELADAARLPLRRAMAQRRDASIDLSIVLAFHSGSSQLTPSATRRLDGLGRDVDAAARIRVDGFAGGIGSPEANRDLAQRRADAVVEYLETLGIRRDQLSAATLRDEAASPNHSVRVTLLSPDPDTAAGDPAARP